MQSRLFCSFELSEVLVAMGCRVLRAGTALVGRFQCRSTEILRIALMIGKIVRRRMMMMMV